MVLEGESGLGNQRFRSKEDKGEEKKDEVHGGWEGSRSMGVRAADEGADGGARRRGAEVEGTDIAMGSPHI